MFQHTKTVAVSAVSLLLASAATAEDGLYYGFGFGQSTLAHEIHRDTGSPESPSITTRSEETDYSLSANVGYHLSLSDQWFVKLEGFYSLENAETKNKNNLLVTQVELNSTFGGSLKPGVHVTEDFAVYAILGVTALDFDIDNSYPFAPPMRSASETEAAFSYGLGGEAGIGEGWTVVAEYSVTKDVSFDPIPEVAVPGKINPNELDLASFSIGVKHRF